VSVCTLKGYGLLIFCQFGWMTGDNVTINDSAIKALGKHIEPTGREWKAKEHHVGYVNKLFGCHYMDL